MNREVDCTDLITFISFDERYVKTDLSFSANYFWSLRVMITILDNNLDFPQKHVQCFSLLIKTLSISLSLPHLSLSNVYLSIFVCERKSTLV